MKNFAYIGLFGGFVFSLLSCSGGNKSELFITNSSQEEIKDVIIDYGSSKDVPIGNLKPNKEFVHVMNLERDDSINLNFKDSAGQNHNLIAAGYVTMGVSDIRVRIEKSKDGEWVTREIR